MSSDSKRSNSRSKNLLIEILNVFYDHDYSDVLASDYKMPDLLFKLIDDRGDQDWEYSVHVSMFEIYNGTISAQHPHLGVGLKPNGDPPPGECVGHSCDRRESVSASFESEQDASEDLGI